MMCSRERIFPRKHQRSSDPMTNLVRRGIPSTQRRSSSLGHASVLTRLRSSSVSLESPRTVTRSAWVANEGNKQSKNGPEGLLQCGDWMSGSADRMLPVVKARTWADCNCPRQSRLFEGLMAHRQLRMSAALVTKGFERTVSCTSWCDAHMPSTSSTIVSAATSVLYTLMPVTCGGLPPRLNLREACRKLFASWWQAGALWGLCMRAPS